MNHTRLGTVTDTLNFGNVNFDSLEEINDYARTICDAASNSGMFSSARPSSGIFSDIRRSAKKWLQEIDSRLNELSPAEALKAIAYYDIIHRIGYCSPAYPETINKHVLRAFNAYIRGDKSVDQYDLFHYISEGLKRRDPAYFDAALDWHSACLDEWFNQFRYGACIERLSDYDTLRRVRCLLESDLWAYTPDQSAYKKRLSNTYRHYINNLTRVRSKEG